MSEEILVRAYSETSHRHAILADDGRTGILYLHAPSDDQINTNEVEATCFVFNRIEPIDLKDVQSYRPNPPPIAKGYASDSAQCHEPDAHDWQVVWSVDGESVLLMRDAEAWCVITPDNTRGFSKAVRTNGPWGSPWSDDVYQAIMWANRQQLKSNSREVNQPRRPRTRRATP